MKLIQICSLLGLSIFFQVNSATITVGVGGDYPGTNLGLQNAINASSNGDTIVIIAGTTVDVNTTTITINKEITLQGQDKSTSIISTVNIDTLMTITSSNVVLNNLTVRNAKNGSSQTVIQCATLYATGLICENLLVQTTELGISFNANTYKIDNCRFEYIGNDATDRYRFIYSYGNFGECIVSNNTFSGQLNNVRTRCIELSDNSFPALRNFVGSLTVENNVYSGGGLDAFILQDSFTGNNGAFELAILNNVVTNNPSERQGSFLVFYTAQNKPLDLYSAISVIGNTFTSTKGVGLLSLEGVGGPFDPATDLSSKLVMCNNMVTNKTMKISDVYMNLDVTSGEALISYELVVYNPFTVALAPCNIGLTTIEQGLIQRSLVDLITWTAPMPGLIYYIYLRNSDGSNTFLGKTVDTFFKY